MVKETSWPWGYLSFLCVGMLLTRQLFRIPLKIVINFLKNEGVFLMCCLWQNKVPHILWDFTQFLSLYFFTTAKPHHQTTSLSHTRAVVLCMSVVCPISISRPKQTGKNAVLKQLHPVFQITALFLIWNQVESTIHACTWHHALEMSQYNGRFHSLSLTVSSFQGRVCGRCAYARREVKSGSPASWINTRCLCQTCEQ